MSFFSVYGQAAKVELFRNQQLFFKKKSFFLLLSKSFCIFANGIGEKSGFVDALAYYFALTEDVWKTTFGIARFKKQGEA